MDVMTLILAIDVGATKTAAALVDSTTGEIAAEETIATACDRPGQLVLEACVQLAERVAGEQRPEAIGIGICELVDVDGMITTEASIAWRNLDVAGAFAHLGSAHIESDVRAAALAEARFGAARWLRSCLYVNVGSGISSCFLLHGAPLIGSNGNAILLGAGPLDVEMTASGKAIERRFGAASVREVVDAAATGDARATEILRSAGAAVGSAVAFAVNILDPEAVVLGGGVALHARLFREQLEETLRKEVAAETTRAIPVVLGELGSRAGVIGAAVAAAARVPAATL
jgi:glucokinase